MEDLEGWAYLLGQALSNRHGAGITRNGRDVKSVILTDISLGGGERVLVDEMQSVVERDLIQLNTDFALFQELVDEEFWTQDRP